MHAVVAFYAVNGLVYVISVVDLKFYFVSGRLYPLGWLPSVIIKGFIVNFFILGNRNITFLELCCGDNCY